MSLFLIACLLVSTSSRNLNQTHLSLLNSITRNCEVVKISESAGFGIVSKKKISQGDTLMIIPPNYILTSFDSYPWFSYFKDSPPNFSLIGRLLYEKHLSKDKSNRKILIESLPDTFSTVLDLNEYEKDYLYKSFGQMKLNLPLNCEEDFLTFEKIHPEVQKCKKCDRNEFMWACKVVLTRAYMISLSNYVKISGRKDVKDLKEKGSALIFGLDLFNHYPIIKTSSSSSKALGLQYFSSPPHIQVKSERDAEPGSELFMSYGSKKNLELFMIHGFIIENNPDDFVLIAIPSDKNDCSYYDPSQKICLFPIQKFFLNPDILNYLFYRLSGSHHSLSSLSDLLTRLSKSGIFSKGNILSILLKYRALVQNYGVDRCRRSIREVRRLQLSSISSSRTSSINNLCLELHSIFTSHLLHLDQAITQSLLDPILKVK
jgi:hypothetical protein